MSLYFDIYLFARIFGICFHATDIINRDGRKNNGKAHLKYALLKSPIRIIFLLFFSMNRVRNGRIEIPVPV